MGASLSREEQDIDNTTKNDTTSSIKKKTTLLEQKINQYAADLILRSNFRDMQSLMKKEECDKFVILTSKVIDKHFHKADINMINKVSDDKVTSEPIEYIKEARLQSEDTKTQEDKSQLCQGLARYYVKIAHLFSAITLTINPTYVYEVGRPKNRYPAYANYIPRSSMTGVDSSSTNTQPAFTGFRGYESTKDTSKTVKLKWDQLRELENYEYAKFKETKLSGFCNERLDTLDPDGILQSQNKMDGLFEIKPTMCDSNTKYKDVGGITGIPDLSELYKDEYDPETKQYTEMSDNMQRQYQTDLESFYKAFTGKKNMPANIKKFSDIKLTDYSKMRGCNDSQSQFPLNFSFIGGKLYKNNEGDLFFSSKDGLINVGIDEITMNSKWPDPSATFIVEEENDFGKAGSRIQLWGRFEPNKERLEISFINQPYGMLKRGQKGSLKMKLFNDYAEKIRDMMSTAQKNKEQLVAILEQLFSKNKIDGYDVVRVSDELTEDKLNKLISETREIIIGMYLACEKNFKEALNIFDAIVDKQILEDSISISERLESKMNEFVGVDPSVLEKELSDVQVAEPIATITEDSDNEDDEDED